MMSRLSLFALLQCAAIGLAAAPPGEGRSAPSCPSIILRGQPQRCGSTLTSAARKLCMQPGLIAASGTERQSVVARHVRGVVFGGMDGILTTFALLAAVAGGTKQTSWKLTLVIGISTVLADALSMAAGEYLSAKAEQELQPTQKLDPDEPGPIEKGLAMFLAFTMFGALPLIGAIISTSLSAAQGIAYDPSSSFSISIAITASTLFALGAIKSQFGVGVWWKAGMEVTGIGSAAAAVAYFTARLVEHLVGE